MSVFVDFIAAFIQAYFVAKIVCNVFCVKKPKERSFAFACFQMMAGYLVVNFIFTGSTADNIVWERVISGLITYILLGFLFYDGSLLYKIGAGIAQYAGMFLVDIGIQVLLFTDFMSIIKVLPVFEMTMLGRGLVTSVFFLLCILVELFSKRKEKSFNRNIGGLALVLALVQLLTLNSLSIANSDGMLKSRVVITILFHFMLTGGYIIVIELYRLLSRSQSKQVELENLNLEIKSQEKLYHVVVKQNEEICNLRHDMKNQLQMLVCMACLKEMEDREKAERMLIEMRNTVKKEIVDD